MPESMMKEIAEIKKTLSEIKLNILKLNAAGVCGVCGSNKTSPVRGTKCHACGRTRYRGEV